VGRNAETQPRGLEKGPDCVGSGKIKKGEKGKVSKREKLFDAEKAIRGG